MTSSTALADGPDRLSTLREILPHFPVAEAQMDTLRGAWVAQAHDLKQSLYQYQARGDSLAVVLKYQDMEMRWMDEDRRRWYHDPRLWFMVGAVAGALAMGLSVQLVF